MLEGNVIVGKVQSTTQALPNQTPKAENYLCKLEPIRHAVNQSSKSPVREIRTPGSVGVGAADFAALLPGVCCRETMWNPTGHDTNALVESGNNKRTLFPDSPKRGQCSGQSPA